MNITLEDHKNWPKTYMLYIIYSETGGMSRSEQAFSWLRHNVVDYKIRRGEAVEFTIYIKDPKLMTIFKLKFSDVCLTEDQI